MKPRALPIVIILIAICFSPPDRGADLGLFSDHSDVGKPSTIGAGSLAFDAEKKTYTITGGGENMWAAADHFHFVYTKMTGDITLSANIDFVGTNPATGKPDNHRKAALMIRQSLDSDAVYADAAAHGDGLTSLQWRDSKGAVTHEVQSNVVGPKHLRIEKRGNTVSMSIASGDEPLHPAGGSAKIELTGDFYVGLAVSSHNVGRLETVAFSNVDLAVPALAPPTTRPMLINTLQITVNVHVRKIGRVAVITCRPRSRDASGSRPTGFPITATLLYLQYKWKAL